MAKWSDYLISGVWYNEDRTQITHVMLHFDDYDKIQGGNRVPIQDAIDILKRHKSILTIQWNYKCGNWDAGEKVVLCEKDGQDSLSPNVQSLIEYEDSSMEPTPMAKITPKKEIFRSIISYVINNTEFNVWSSKNPDIANKTYLYLAFVSDVLNAINIDETKVRNVNSKEFERYMDEIIHKSIPNANGPWLRFISTGVAEFFAADSEHRKKPLWD